MKKNIALFMLTVLVLTTCFSLNPITANAETDLELVKTTTCTINGVNRTLTLYEDKQFNIIVLYLSINDKEPENITSSILDAGFDKYGNIWYLYFDKAVCYVKDSDSVSSIPETNPDVPDKYKYEVQSLVYNDQGFVTGYKTTSGEIYPITDLGELDYINPTEDKPSPTPVVTPEPTPVGTPAPSGEKKNTPSPSNSNKVTIKKKNGFTCLYTGTKVTSQYKLKKGTLTWKNGNKLKKIKAVKSAGFIKKSKNLIYMTKQGKVYIISQKGKKKLVVKKGAKKLVKKGKFVTKITRTSGKAIVVTNK